VLAGNQGIRIRVRPNA